MPVSIGIIKKWFKYGLILLIVVIITILSIQKCSHHVKENKTENKDDKQVIQNTQKSDSLERVVTTLQYQLVITHVKDSLSKIASNRLISYWKRKALDSRGRIDTIIQSNPGLKEAFEDADSLLSVTEKRNEALEKEKSTQWNDFNKILSITEEQLKLQQETSAILGEQRNRYKRKSEKRFTVGPFIGFDYKLQPTIGIGLQYRVFRF